MTSQAQLIFFLVIVALNYGDAAPFAVGKELTFKDVPISHGISVEKVVHVAKLDKIFDTLLPHIRNIILRNGLDPMDLIDFSESLLPFMPGIFKGKIDLKNGWLQNLSKIKRSKHITATYSDKCLVLDMDLGFNLMDFNYEYYLQYLLFRREGDINGRFYNADVKVMLTIDITNYHVKMDSIKFSNVDKYDIKFEGNLLDRLLNLATKAVTLIFKNKVFDYIESRGLKVFNTKLDEWNKNFPPKYRTDLIEEWIYNSVLNVELY